MKKWCILATLLLGLAVRLATTAAPGNEDMRDHQIWGAWAVEQGMTRAYVYEDSDYLEKLYFKWNHIPRAATRTSVPTALGVLDHVPDYPPLGVYILGASAWLGKTVNHGRLQQGPVLNACLNLVPFLCGLGIVGVCWSFSRRHGMEFAWFPLALFWLNPALILHSPIHGYVDPAYAFFGLCSLVALYEKKFPLAALTLAAACLTKPQAVLLLPIAALVLWMERNGPELRRTLLSFVLVLLLPFVPFIAASRFLAAARGISQVASLDYLSSNQVNFWWLMNWVQGAVAGGSLGALADPVTIVRIANPASLGFLGLRIAAATAALGLTVLNLRWLYQELRRGNRMAIFWSAAIQVYVFTSVSLYPKENHLYGFFVYLLPLLFLAKRQIVAAYAALSLVFGMNLFLFDGFGMGWERPGHALRMLLGFDLTVLVAALNVAFFVWLMTRPRWLFGLTACETVPADRNGN